MSIMTILTEVTAKLPPPSSGLPQATPDAVSPAKASGQVQTGALSSIHELDATLIVLAFGLIALFLLYMIVRSDRTREFELRIFIITILVFGSLLVMTAGLGQDQLTPVIGFFGTIAGYVLGGGKLGENSPHSSNERPNDRG